MFRATRNPHLASPILGVFAIFFCSIFELHGYAQVITAPDADFFEKKIRPVLVEHCFPCHGPEAKRIEANLRLDSLAGMRKGGDSGNAIDAVGDKNSLLLSAIQYDDFEMPPGGKLPATVIADFDKWIADGALAPDSFHDHGGTTSDVASATAIDWKLAREHWAFRPVQDVSPPIVEDDSWNANPIDAFVFDQLKKNGQDPVGIASRHELVRRLYLDLIGMTPTVAEINEFINDDSTDAERKLVDRLLDLPHYGERWGRHWLDVVRYADSNGADENHPYPLAWRYRNYVIDSFNRDAPFDQFLTEQLAGDLLPQTNDYDQSNRRLAATTFLALGIKIDAEKDQEKKRADIIDEQLDTIGRAMLGMTIGCARCHDHKFDPIPTSDYYALSGILRSTNLQDRKLVSAEEDSITQKLVEINSQLVELAEEEVNIVLASASNNPSQYISAACKVNNWRRENLDPEVVERLSTEIKGASLSPIGEVTQQNEFVLPGVWFDAESYARGQASVDKDNYGAGIGIVTDQGGQPTWVEYDFELPSSGIYQVEFRYAAEASRPSQLSLNGSIVNEKCMAETTGSWYPDGQKWHVEGRYKFEPGKNTLRIEVDGGMSHLDQLLIVRVGDYPKREDDESAAPDSPIQVARRESLELGALKCWADLLLDLTARMSQEELDSFEPSQLIKRLADEDGPLSDIIKAEKYFPESTKQTLNKLREQSSELQNQLEGFAERLVMSVGDGEIQDASIFIRGNHRQAGAQVPRRFLTIIDGESQETFSKRNSGRIELAQAITSAKNPLTARVIVNRVWRWHFGRGIVDSTENFGLSGAEPTHPELLDFLATYLIENDWSIKELHRLIVSSRTYRSSSKFSATQAQLDPENMNLWRWQPRRLEAEAIRDSFLRISGRLDSEVGGAPLMGVTTINTSPQDVENNRKFYEDSRRRTVYLPVVRTNVYKYLTLFDFPNPAAPKGNRDTTTVPTQALFLLNSSWVRDLATDLATTMTSEFETNESRISNVYLLVFGREPSQIEIRQAKDFLNDDQGGWPAFCHVLLMSNEFLYLK